MSKNHPFWVHYSNTWSVKIVKYMQMTPDVLTTTIQVWFPIIFKEYNYVKNAHILQFNRWTLIYGQLCHTCNTCVVFYIYYICRTCVLHMYLLHMYITCISTHVIHVYDYTPVLCTKCVLHVFYTCITISYKVYTLHV